MHRNEPTRGRGLVLLVTLGIVTFAGATSRVYARQNQNRGQQQGQNRGQQGASAENRKIEVLPVQGNVYMIVGAGANITMQVGDEALLLVNAGAPGTSKEVLAAIRTISDKAISYIIDTNGDDDATGGNHELGVGGVFAQFVGSPLGARSGAAVMAHINVLKRMSDGKTPPELLPTDPYDTEGWAMFNNEGVVMDHATAHTDGDTIVFFRRSDVVSTGDLFTPEHFPIINLDKGGSVNGTIGALNHIVDDLLITKFGEEGGTYVIPGHGRLCDRTDITNYRDMVTIVRDRVQEMLKKGMTLDQVKAARPALGYESLYGGGPGTPVTNTFVETVYRDLSTAKNKQGQ